MPLHGGGLVALPGPTRKVNRLTNAKAGHHIQIITAYPASLEMMIATSSHHGSIVSA